MPRSAKLRGRSRAKRTMWSRRAQEYQAKIASGDPGSIAEVVRDCFGMPDNRNQSYSERQIYQAALDRFVREFSRGRADRRDHRPPSASNSCYRLDWRDEYHGYGRCAGELWSERRR